MASRTCSRPSPSAGPLAALRAAKLLGAGAWIIAAAVLAIAVDRAVTFNPTPLPHRPAIARLTALLLLTASAPLAAWSVAGMETGLVIALATLAVALRQLDRPRAGAAAAGLSAALRPELSPGLS